MKAPTKTDQLRQLREAKAKRDIEHKVDPPVIGAKPYPAEQAFEDSGFNRTAKPKGEEKAIRKKPFIPPLITPERLEEDERREYRHGRPPGNRQTPRAGKRVITIYVDPELHKELKIHALECECTMEAFVEAAIRQAIKHGQG